MIKKLTKDKCVLLQLQEKRKAEGDSASVSLFEVFVRTKVRKRDGAWATHYSQKVAVNHL